MKYLAAVLASLCLCHVNGLRDGDLYRFTSLRDDNAITASGDKTSSGVNITVEPYNDGSNQKWLAVATSSAGDSFYLLPKRQSWSWNNFAKDSTRDRLGHLPDFTVVMSLDLQSGFVAQLGFTGSKPQQWKTVDAPNGAFLIKSLHDDKCLYNSGEKEKKEGVFAKAKDSITSIFKKSKKEKKRIPPVLLTKECDPAIDNQLWKSEVVK